MAITIKNNTDKLQNLKNKVNALPDKETSGGTIVLDLTTVTPADVLANKTYYSADADGQPVKGTGEMNNLGEINVEVGLDGTGQDLRNGYITGVTVTFSEEVNDEIDTQAELIAQIKSVLNNKMAGSGETLKGLIDGSVTELVIPEGTTEIRRYAFAYLSNLESISIPDSILKIGAGAFNECNSLRTNVGAAINGYSVRYLGNDNNKYLVAYDTSNIYISTAILHESTCIIAPSAFFGSSKLNSFTFSNNVKFIGNYAFASCKELTSLVIPSSVLEIDTSALQIGSSENKATIRFEGTTPPSIQSSTFYASYLEKIEVPISALDTYKTATNWSAFADYIVGY